MRTLLLLFLLPQLAPAQQPFVEGTIEYAVNLTPANGSESLGTHAGTYTITVKGTRVRRELKMAGGFQNVILLDATAGTAYSLQATPSRKYAIRLDTAQLAQRARAYQHYSLKEAGAPREVGKNRCTPHAIKYADGSSGLVCISTAWLPENPALQERFPHLPGIPLAFDYRTEAGALLSFQAVRVEAAPVSEEVFRIPPGYQPVSEDAYRDSGY